LRVPPVMRVGKIKKNQCHVRSNIPAQSFYLTVEQPVIRGHDMSHASSCVLLNPRVVPHTLERGLVASRGIPGSQRKNVHSFR